MTPFCAIEEALAELSAGRMVVVVDTQHRENEADLTLAAQFTSAETINFMATHGRGLIRLAMTPQRCDELGLELLPARGESPHQTAFTVSIEARHGTTTGISAQDRAHTVQVAVDPESGPRDLVKPGHMFPIKARPGGVLERASRTEAAIDLARLAGLQPAGVICQIMNPDGTMAQVPDLFRFCTGHGLKMVTIADLITYRCRSERIVERVLDTPLPSRYGAFRIAGYRSLLDGREHAALVLGDIAGMPDVPVRVHTECLTTALGSLLCDRSDHHREELACIAAEGRSVLLFLAPDDRHGSGLLSKPSASEPRRPGPDTVDDADLRNDGVVAAILSDLGLHSIRPLRNNPQKNQRLKGHLLRATDQAPMPRVHNRRHLDPKTPPRDHPLATSGASR